MPDTITTYATFTPASKARSSEVNSNFANHRGNLLPINSDTASASHLTHNLGSAEHRWKTAFAEEINFRTSTTTAGLNLKGDTSATTGAFLFQIGGTTVAQVTPTGIPSAGIQPGSFQLFSMTFTANGSFTVPVGTTDILATVVGGGGGGGEGGGASATAVGGEGGYGAPLSLISRPVSAGMVLSITVGTGGTGGSGGGATGVAGSSGSSSYLYFGTTTSFIRGQGGSGGAGGTHVSPAQRTLTARLAKQFAGGQGGSVGEPGESSALADGGVAGGGAAQTNGGGGAASYGTGGAGGDGGNTANPGITATGYGAGGGGGGGSQVSGNGGNGGNGGPGIVVIHYIKQ